VYPPSTAIAVPSGLTTVTTTLPGSVLAGTFTIREFQVRIGSGGGSAGGSSDSEPPPSSRGGPDTGLSSITSDDGFTPKKTSQPSWNPVPVIVILSPPAITPPVGEIELMVTEATSGFSESDI